MPTAEGRRGNPVLWSRRFFPELAALEGDIEAHGRCWLRTPKLLSRVRVLSQGAFLDVDTPDAFGGRPLSRWPRLSKSLPHTVFFTDAFQRRSSPFISLQTMRNFNNQKYFTHIYN